MLVGTFRRRLLGEPDADADPERIVAIWFRSGTAFETWEKGEIPRPEIPAAAYQIPMMCNPGVKENETRFKGA